MARRQTIFTCQECGATSPKWLGRCPDCNSWGSVVEELRDTGTKGRQASPAPEPVPLTAIPDDKTLRIKSGFPEFDQVLGGGMVPGSVILLGGDPGVGKSTLILQILMNIAEGGTRVLYVTAEESIRQIRMRARRTGTENENLLVMAATGIPGIADAVSNTEPEVLVLDSVQTLHHPDISSAPGSISQVRQIAADAVSLAKSRDMATWLIGHVTKDGALAGPRALEHLVDTVIYFEGETAANHRIIRAVKNRYGSTNEIAIFEMTGQGLVEVTDPSSLFLPSSARRAPGSAIVMGLEGTRPLLVEVQALVSDTPFPNPRRTTSGLDMAKVLLILAVLDKRAGVQSGGLDVFVNVAGGLRLTEPAADLGIALALVSSMREMPLAENTVFAGELGLSGEVRSVVRLENRLREAARLNFTRAVIPASGSDRIPEVSGISVIPVDTIEDALETAFS
ncbi:MAG: DNA repair protein RadA [bacterium]